MFIVQFSSNECQFFDVSLICVFDLFLDIIFFNISWPVRSSCYFCNFLGEGEGLR